MVDERYNIINKGELLEGYNRDLVIPELIKLFNVNEKAIIRLFTNKPKKFIRNITWEQAIRYQKKLNSIGLITYLDVVLNPDILRDSIVPVNTPNKNYTASLNNSNINQNNKEQSFQFFKFNSNKLVPVLGYPHHTETIFDKEENSKFNLQSYNHTINPKFILLFSMFSGLLIQKYFTMLMALESTGQIVTYLSIVLFFLVILFLPKIMTPNRVVAIRESKNDITYLVSIQNQSYNPFVNSYNIYSPENNYLATVKNNKLKSHYECFNDEGNILFTSSEEHNVDDFTKNITENLRDELFDFSILNYINTISRWFKNVVAWYKKRPNTYHREDAFVVRDSEAQKIAYFYKNKISAIEVPDFQDDENKLKIVMAFLLICVGVD